MAERLGRFLLRQRVIVLIIILGITGFFGYQAANIQVLQDRGVYVNTDCP